MRFFGHKIFTVIEMTEQDSQRSQKYLNFRAKIQDFEFVLIKFKLILILKWQFDK